MKVCGAKKVVSTLTNSVNVTSGPPCLAVIKRKDASVTPSIGERPMMGFSIFCQKFILPSVRVPQPNTPPNRRGSRIYPKMGSSERFCRRSYTLRHTTFYTHVHKILRTSSFFCSLVLPLYI